MLHPQHINAALQQIDWPGYAIVSDSNASIPLSLCTGALPQGAAVLTFAATGWQALRGLWDMSCLIHAS